MAFSDNIDLVLGKMQYNEGSLVAFNICSISENKLYWKMVFFKLRSVTRIVDRWVEGT